MRLPWQRVIFMGQEIEATQFSDEDFAQFAGRLHAETRLLEEWFREGVFSGRDRMGGYEREAWLVDDHACPAPVNDVFLRRLDDALVVP